MLIIIIINFWFLVFLDLIRWRHSKTSKKQLSRVVLQKIFWQKPALKCSCGPQSHKKYFWRRPLRVTFNLSTAICWMWSVRNMWMVSGWLTSGFVEVPYDCQYCWSHAEIGYQLFRRSVTWNASYNLFMFKNWIENKPLMNTEKIICAKK